MLAAIERFEKNPFELSVKEQLDRLHAASTAWESCGDVYNRLRETAPEWPNGRDVFRSLRIRFGTGSEGVSKTFEHHAVEIEHVFGEDQYQRAKTVLSFTHTYSKNDPARLRLLAGNDTHKPVIEWVIVDLSAHRKCTRIADVRGPKSIADEGLVLAWMFPERIRATDYEELPAFFLAGYELNVPEECAELWDSVPYISFDLGNHKVELNYDWCSSDRSDYSVPVFRER